MALFKHKLTGEIVERPAHYATHPVYGKKLELVNSSTTSEPKKKRSWKAEAKVEAEVFSEPLTSAAETELAKEIEVNIENN